MSDTEKFTRLSLAGAHVDVNFDTCTTFTVTAQAVAVPQAKIIGGRVAAAGEIPWQVSVQTSNGRAHFCGGSIISSEWVVTTARCTLDRTPEEIVIGAGSIDRLTPKSVHKVSQIFANSSFQTLFLTGDLAVLRVTPPFEWSLEVAPIALPSSRASTGLLATVSGWGTTSINGPNPVLLQRAQVPIYDNKDCNTLYSLLGGVPEDQICAGFRKGGVDACSGDGGGPLFADGVLYGVVSWGFGCATKFPGIYTEIFYHKDWIKKITGV
ncbi:trypsin-like [Neocloeon triangulifer]|uniref:trypsin-like n=1 Tax=Neocloeon triangulifer TaxID=2078957 RepID=UPI00286F106F|nr:trypsin-like [Neocloeon triangulifer]